MIDKIKEKINNLLSEKVEKKQTKENGVVYTPLFLVNDMMDTLPYEVWTNPDLKWLDPSNGFGTFFSVIVERLMKGLEQWEPNEKLRYKHILENMLYACELQKEYAYKFKQIFDPENIYDINIYVGSYLEEGFDKHMKEIWGIDKWDCVIMNPPYQKLKEGNKKSQQLWDKFVIKTISQLAEGGYLVSVNPSGWRNVSGRFKYIQNLLKSRQMIYLEMHSVKDGQKTFKMHTV